MMILADFSYSLITKAFQLKLPLSQTINSGSFDEVTKADCMWLSLFLVSKTLFHIYSRLSLS